MSCAHKHPASFGFTLIELALVLLVTSIVLSGLLGLLQTYSASRQTAIQNEAVEKTKTSVILLSINTKTIKDSCVAGTCSGLLSTLQCAATILTAPCPSFTSTYLLPAVVSVTTEKDYWGNSLIYSQVANSVSNTTSPTDIIFKLTSYGADTSLGGGDDVVYEINASEFMTRVSRMGF